VKSLPLALLLFLGACHEEGEYFGTTERTGKDEHTFYLNLHDEPEYLDPGLVSEAGGSALIEDLFDGLSVYDPKDLHATQGAAESYEKSDDNRIYRFHLRADERWSDGKPVVAGDYVYAWRRVLAAETGARQATMLYVIQNAPLYHQGRLKALKRAERLRPAIDASDGEELAAGTALRILVTTPAATAVAPLDAALGADAEVYFDPAAKDAPAALSAKGGQAITKALAAPAAADVLEVGAEARCNDTPDRWYRVRSGGSEGWLPGCAIAEDAKQAHAALVEIHRDLPTFVPGTRQKPGNHGFVAIDALVRDPAVLGLRAVGDDVVEVELDKPTPYFLDLTAYPTLAPVRQDVIEHFAAGGDGDRWFRPENMVSNGPYVFKEHRFRYELVLERNPHHPDFDKLKIHRIVWNIVPNYHATMNLFKTGEIDYIGSTLSLPNEFMDLLERYKDFSRVPWVATYWYEFNVEKPPLDDVRVRHALDLAVDKKTLIDKVTQGDQLPATHFVPPNTGSGYDEAEAAAPLFAGPEHAFNPERARQLLREAGYNPEQTGDGWSTKGFPPIEILYNTSEGHRTIAVTIQGMWKENLGISVQLRNEEWKVFLKNLRDGNYQVSRFGWIADYNHPQTFMDVFLSFSGNNWTNWKDTRFDAMVEQAAAEPDPKKSIALYRQAEELVVEAMPRMPIYFYTKSTLIKPWVKGYWDNAMNRHAVRWMWIDPSWRTDHDNRPAFPVRDYPPPGRLEPR
jgi:oligopeptide transport system substrate-binding protein